MSVLDELVTGAVEDQQAREQKIPLDEVKRQAFAATAPIDARQWLKRSTAFRSSRKSKEPRHRKAI